MASVFSTGSKAESGAGKKEVAAVALVVVDVVAVGVAGAGGGLKPSRERKSLCMSVR